MSDQITFRTTEQGIDIHLRGLGGLLGFSGILMRAKFAAEPRAEVLLSPYVNDLLRLIVEKARTSDLGGEDWYRSLPAEQRQRIVDEIAEYAKKHSDLVSDIDKAMQDALYPFS